MGLWASQKARERRKNGQHPQPEAPALTMMREVNALTKSGKPKPFRDILRESYWKREQAKRDRDKTAKELASMQRFERQRLYGYVRTIDGRTLTIDEATKQMMKGKLTRNEIAEWHSPEIYVDNVDSLGEKDATGEYPALGIEEGTVIRDPKIRVTGGHTDPALQHRTPRQQRREAWKEFAIQTARSQGDQRTGGAILEDENVRWQERKRLFTEAFYDKIDSLGEVVAVTDSDVLGVKRADVLADPKQRPYGYTHPKLRRE